MAKVSANVEREPGSEKHGWRKSLPVRAVDGCTAKESNLQPFAYQPASDTVTPGPIGSCESGVTRPNPRSAPKAATESGSEVAAAPSLFDFPRTPPSVAVDTSEDAAQAVKCIASKLRRQVFATLLASGGLTCDELCQRFNRGGNTMRPRLRELEDQGLIVKSAERRPTHTGSLAVVYQVTDKGCRAYREAA